MRRAKEISIIDMLNEKGLIMKPPEVKKGEWIIIRHKENSRRVDGYVFDIFTDDTLSVGYLQNNAKPIKEEVVWSGNFWEFKYDDPSGSYLKGSEAAIVKRGPIGK